MDLVEAALYYSGVLYRPIIPLRVEGKEPSRLVRRGLKQATTDVTRVEKWWTKEPRSNIALVTGKGLLVIDVDGPAAEENLAKLQKLQRASKLPRTVEAKTGRTEGGRHLFFSVARDLPSSKGRLAPGIDVKCAGGYVVAPPSIHPDSKQPYIWINPPGATRLAPAPAWLVGIIEALGESPTARPPRAASTGAPSHRDTSPSGLDAKHAIEMLQSGSTDEEILDALTTRSGKGSSYCHATLSWAHRWHERHLVRATVVRAVCVVLRAKEGKPLLVRVQVVLMDVETGEYIESHIVVPTKGREGARRRYEAVFGATPIDDWRDAAVAAVRCGGLEGAAFDAAVVDGEVKWLARASVNRS